MEILDSKLISLCLLLVLTLGFGILPYIFIKFRISSLSSQTYDTIFHILNAFAGGVFLGTCLLHLLAEGREELDEALTELKYHIDYPLFEAAVAVGFFLIVIVDFIADYCLHVRSDTTGANSSVNHSHTNYRTFQEEDVAIVPPPPTDIPHTHDFSELASIRSPVKAVLLLVALSFHTIFDGLAVGLQNSSSDVWQVMLAVGIHKSIVAFCLGLQLYNAYINRPLVASAMLVFFSLMSPIGLGIGIGITSGNVNNASKLLASAILQAFATGTFLYVTFFEILRDPLVSKRSIWHILASALGFAFMAGVKVLDTD